MVSINVAVLRQAQLVIGLLTTYGGKTSRYVTIYTGQLSLPSLGGLLAFPGLLVNPHQRPTWAGRRAGDSPARRPGPMAGALPRSRSPVPLPTRPFWAQPAMLIVHRRRWGPFIGRERRRVRPVIAPPPSRPRRRSNSDHAGNSTYSSEIESLDRDPGIATLVPGMRFPGN